MLTIEIKINGKPVAGAQVANISDLADYSDYQVEAVESASPVSGLPNYYEAFQVRNHYRPQSAWALVERVAAMCARSRFDRIGEPPQVAFPSRGA